MPRLVTHVQFPMDYPIATPGRRIPHLHAARAPERCLQQDMLVHVDAKLATCTHVDRLGARFAWFTGGDVWVAHDDVPGRCKTTDGCNVRTPHMTPFKQDGLPKGWVKRSLRRKDGRLDAVYMGLVGGHECFASSKARAFRVAKGERVSDPRAKVLKTRWRRNMY